MSETDAEFVERMAKAIAGQSWIAPNDWPHLINLASLGAMVSDMESKTRAIVGEPLPSPPAGETGHD